MELNFPKSEALEWSKRELKENQNRTVCELACSLIFLHNYIKGGNSMRNWVERLVRCGIPEKTAQTVIDFFFRNRRTVELIAYVRMTEEALGRK